jgi:hypothetical protein
VLRRQGKDVAALEAQMQKMKEDSANTLRLLHEKESQMVGYCAPSIL